jgi:hypothetical protein
MGNVLSSAKAAPIHNAVKLLEPVRKDGKNWKEVSGKDAGTGINFQAIITPDPGLLHGNSLMYKG